MRLSVLFFFAFCPPGTRRLALRRPSPRPTMPGVVDAAAVASQLSTLKMSAVDTKPLMDAVLGASTSQESLEASVVLCNAITAEPSSAHHVLANLLPSVASAAADKKSGSNRESAMIIYGTLYERLPPKAPATEVLLVEETLGIVFDALSDKGAVVRESAQYAIDAIVGVLKQPALVVGLLESIEKYLSTSAAKWQGRVAALQTIGKMAEKAAKADKERGEVFLKDVLGRELEGLIPVVENAMHDLKNEVSKTAVKTMNSLTKLLSNDDVSKHIPMLVKTMKEASKENTQKAIHDLR